jgi:hypothetical protein
VVGVEKPDQANLVGVDVDVRHALMVSMPEPVLSCT